MDLTKQRTRVHKQKLFEINLAIYNMNIFVCYTIPFQILHILVSLQKQLTHVHINPLGVIVHACVMSCRTLNNEICSAQIGKMSYLLSVKEESLLFLTYDVVQLQDLSLVMQNEGGREGQAQCTQ